MSLTDCIASCNIIFRRRDNLHEVWERLLILVVLGGPHKVAQHPTALACFGDVAGIYINHDYRISLKSQGPVFIPPHRSQ